MLDEKIFDMLLKEAEKAQPLKSQRFIYKNIFDLFKSELSFIDGDVLEIGTFKGKTTRFLSILLETQYPEKRLFSIDPYIDSGFKDFTVKPHSENTWKHFKKVISDLSNHSHYRNRSEDVKDNFEDKSLCFIFIDGDHSYEGVMKDFNNYISKVVSGGIIGFDDYKNKTKFTVWKAIEEIKRSKRVELFSEKSKEIYFKVL